MKHTQKLYICSESPSVGCSELSVDNGWVTVTDDTAVYNCTDGYKLDRLKNTRKCWSSMDQGYEWSGTAPICIPICKYTHTHTLTYTHIYTHAHEQTHKCTNAHTHALMIRSNDY